MSTSVGKEIDLQPDELFKTAEDKLKNKKNWSSRFTSCFLLNVFSLTSTKWKSFSIAKSRWCVFSTFFFCG